MQNNSVKNTKCSLYCNCTFIFLQIAIASKLQGELIRQGLDPFASKVVMDTVPYTSYIRDVHHYNGINKALKSLVTTSSKWHFRLICLAVSLFDTQWVEIILGSEFLFLFTFIFRIIFLSFLGKFELFWRWIYCSLDPTTNSETTNPEFSWIYQYFWQKKNIIAYKQTKLVLFKKIIKIGIRSFGIGCWIRWTK